MFLDTDQKLLCYVGTEKGSEFQGPQTLKLADVLNRSLFPAHLELVKRFHYLRKLIQNIYPAPLRKKPSDI